MNCTAKMLMARGTAARPTGTAPVPTGGVGKQPVEQRPAVRAGVRRRGVLAGFTPFLDACDALRDGVVRPRLALLAGDVALGLVVADELLLLRVPLQLALQSDRQHAEVAA